MLICRLFLPFLFMFTCPGSISLSFVLSFSLTFTVFSPSFLCLYLFLPHTLLTYLLRLLLCPIPVNLLSWLCVTSRLSLSLTRSPCWMLWFHYCIIHHSCPVCAVVPRCVWVIVAMCLLCWGDASLRAASPAGHFNFHWECVLPCVCVWLWYTFLNLNLNLLSWFPPSDLHPSHSSRFIKAFLLYYFGDTHEDYPANLHQICWFRQLEGKCWSEAWLERCELLNVFHSLRGLWSLFVTICAI